MDPIQKLLQDIRSRFWLGQSDDEDIVNLRSAVEDLKKARTGDRLVWIGGKELTLVVSGDDTILVTMDVITFDMNATSVEEEIVDKPLFIIWDPKDGLPHRSQIDGKIDSSGLCGSIPLENVFLSTYGVRPENSKRFEDLVVGECVEAVRFNLSGGSKYYSVYRVE